MKTSEDLDAQVKKALSSPPYRKQLVTQLFFWFLHIYFPDYLTFPVANFHREIILLLQNLDNNLVFAAFRGSGKSTIVSLAFVIWSMISSKSKKFIVICSNTAKQSELLMFNIKSVLETHPLLKHDLGPFYETSEQWNISSLVFSNYDTKIMAISVNESVRGIRYKNRRPDLIILDDVETLDTVRSEENRDKLLTWFDRDIVPLGDENTNIIVVGTIMTMGSLVSTLKQRIESGVFSGTFKKYPIVDSRGNILWDTRWKSKPLLEDFKKKQGIVNSSWETEYLLNDYIKEDQIITENMIRYYDEIPLVKYSLVNCYIGVDPAVSENPESAKTAIVCGYILDVENKYVLYILPNPVNKRLNFHEIIGAIESKADGMPEGCFTYIFVEDVQSQRYIIEVLQEDGYVNAKPFKVGGKNKKARLETTVHNLELDKIKFPRIGAESLLNQIIRFDYEHYKDLADAYASLVIMSFQEAEKGPGATVVPTTGLFHSVGSIYESDWEDGEEHDLFGSQERAESIQFED